jgi:DNA polymerase (family 10)
VESEEGTADVFRVELQDRHAIAALLKELAALLTLRGENRYKARAYERGAAALEHLEEDLGILVHQNRLTEIPGIGNSLASVVSELWNTGTSKQLEKLRSEIPRGVVELSRVRGISEQAAARLVNELGVDSIASLERALDEGRVRTMKGYGEKTEERMREALARHAVRRERVAIYEARAMGERWVKRLRADPAILAADYAGELRRYHDSIDTLVLVAASEDPGCAARYAKVSDIVKLEMTVVPKKFYGAALIIRTGSASHVAQLQARAAKSGLSLATLEGETEEEVYKKIGLAYVPPELREGLGEVAEAEKADAFTDLISLSDLRGLVHCHTTYSDGVASVEEMARAADELGYEYMTITDHSPSAFYAGGLDTTKLAQQGAEISAVQKAVRVQLLRGTESDILANGDLDYPADILGGLEVVIASIHSRFKQDENSMTERICRAMAHPRFKIWGHPLGRLIMKRDPVPCRVEEVLDVIARSRAAIEITGDPHRYELAPNWIRAARERNIPFVVSVDAHSTKALGYAELGVHLARRGGVQKRDVLNTLSVTDFRKATAA